MTNALDVCVGADALAVLTEWDEFESIDPNVVFEKLNLPQVVDGRNVLNKEAWIDAGFRYRGVGR